MKARKNWHKIFQELKNRQANKQNVTQNFISSKNIFKEWRKTQAFSNGNWEYVASIPTLKMTKVTKKMTKAGLLELHQEAKKHRKE